jgi:mRNA-degrading endonuclease RelE of RelBE toxin-antitoxin system
MFAIVREPSFEEQMLRLVKTHQRMAQLDQAIDWALRNHPHRIPNIVRFPPDFYLWVTDEFFEIDIPSVRILYRIDSNTHTVYLLSIQEVTDKDRDVLSNG